MPCITGLAQINGYRGETDGGFAYDASIRYGSNEVDYRLFVDNIDWDLVKEKSKNLQCRANIRSLAAAFRLYTETNDGKVFGYGIGRLITYGCFKFRANWEILTRSVIAPRQN